MEELLGRIRNLHRGQGGGRGLPETQGRRQRLQRQLEQLEQRQEELEGLWQQKQEALRVARLRWQEVEAEGQRRRGLFLGRQQQLEGEGQQRSRIRELRRGHRREFQKQLQELVEEHKRLKEAHAPSQLEAELVRLEEEEGKLLSQERSLLELEEQLGPQGHLVTRWVQQEQEGAEQRLRALIGRRERAKSQWERLQEELKRLQRPLAAQEE